jgi:hypothetical protein
MTKEDEEKFDDMSWELQLLGAKVAVFMMEHKLDCLSMSCGPDHVLTIQEEQPEHGLDEKRNANGE